MDKDENNFYKTENNLFFKVLSKRISPDDLRLLQIMTFWLKNPGRPIADYAFPCKLDSQSGILEIICYPQAYAQEIMYFKKDIIDGLNNSIKGLNIKDFKISVDRLKTEKFREQIPARAPKITTVSSRVSEKVPSPDGQTADEGIARLREISRRICELEFSRGARKCRKCSLPARRGSDLCSLCRGEEREAVDSTVIRYLNSDIYQYRPGCRQTVLERINAELAAKKLPKIDLERYNSLKKKILSQNKNEIWKYIYSQPEGSIIDNRLSAMLVELACLISEKTLPELDDNILLKALGPSLASIYNSKTVRHIRSSRKNSDSIRRQAPPS